MSLLPFGSAPGVPKVGTYATSTTVVETDQVAGDTAARLSRDASGKFLWGPGNGVGDTNLYRDQAAVLRTDHTFFAARAINAGLATDAGVGRIVASESIRAARGSTTEVGIGAIGPAGASAINFQNGETGSDLYRVSSGILKIDGSLQLGTGATGGKLTTSRGIASGALPTITFTSTTGAQVDTTSDRFVSVPITYTLIGSTVKVEVSPDNVTYSTIVTKAPGIAGDVDTVDLFVPAGWYVKLTTTNATIAAASYW